MTPAKKPGLKAPNIKDPALRSVWRRFGLRPPPVTSSVVSSSCSTFSNASNDVTEAKRGWDESDKGPIRPVGAPSLTITDSDCNGIASSCRINSDSLEKTCIKLDMMEAQLTSATAAANTQLSSAAAAAAGTAAEGAPNGVSQSFFHPIFLPIDRNYESKYLMQKYRLGQGKRGRSFREKTYLFLEHPCGWFGFMYHMSV